MEYDLGDTNLRNRKYSFPRLIFKGNQYRHFCKVFRKTAALDFNSFYRLYRFRICTVHKPRRGLISTHTNLSSASILQLSYF